MTPSKGNHDRGRKEIGSRQRGTIVMRMLRGLGAVKGKFGPGV